MSVCLTCGLWLGEVSLQRIVVALPRYQDAKNEPQRAVRNDVTIGGNVCQDGLMDGGAAGYHVGQHDEPPARNFDQQVLGEPSCHAPPLGRRPPRSPR